jgi:hypothetical protein
MERWGIPLPPRADIHSFVRLRFVYAAQPDVKQVGLDLEDLGRLRTQADYQLAVPGPFSTAARATQAVTSAETAIARLDAIEADSARRAAAIAALRAVGP